MIPWVNAVGDPPQDLLRASGRVNDIPNTQHKKGKQISQNEKERDLEGTNDDVKRTFCDKS